MNPGARRLVLAGLVLLAASEPLRAAQPAPPSQFTLLSGGHPLAVWARVPKAPRAVLVLVHGRTWSSRPDFDLHVPGAGPRSVMASLAARGVAAYAVDLRGYGATPRDRTGLLSPRQAATDVAAVVQWVSNRHRELPPPALLGWSLGGAVAHLTVQQSDVPLSALVLFGYAIEPGARFAAVPVPEAPAMARTTRADAEADFISPLVTPRSVVEAFVQQALASDPVRMDWVREEEFNALRGDRLVVPTLVIHGARDPGMDPGLTARFFASLAAPNRQLTVLPGGDHAAQIEDTHEGFIDAVVDFLFRPAPARR